MPGPKADVERIQSESAIKGDPETTQDTAMGYMPLTGWAKGSRRKIRKGSTSVPRERARRGEEV